MLPDRLATALVLKVALAGVMSLSRITEIVNAARNGLKSPLPRRPS